MSGTAKNVLDHFKDMQIEDIKYTLEKNRGNFSVLLDNRTKNLNAGSTVRTCHLNLAKHIVFYGRRDYNRVPSVFSYKFENITVCHNMEELREFIKSANVEKIVGFDNNISRETQYLHKYQWDKNLHTMMCFGSEGEGMPNEILDICNDIVESKQLGAVRSFNLANLAAMAMYDYSVKTGRFD